MKKIIKLSALILSAIVLTGCSTKTTTPEITETITPTNTEIQTGNEIVTPEVVTKPTVEQAKPIPVAKPPVKETTTTPPPATNTETPAKNPDGYTLSDIAMHAARSDCWTSINGNVYNITSAFGKHPGGDDKLATLCGIEGTVKFNQMHGTNEKAKGRLATLKIGTLK